MEGHRRGKFGMSVLLSLLLISASAPASRLLASCDPIPAEDERDRLPRDAPQVESTAVDGKQQVLLQTLEELVRNLSEVVSRLESRLAEAPAGGVRVRGAGEDRRSESPKFGVALDKDVAIGGRRYSDMDLAQEGREEGGDGFEVKSRDGERMKGVSITKYSPFWSEKFHFASAVKLDFEATCINVLPFRDYEGLSKYVAVGDERGKVYVFLRNGDVLVEFKTVTDSPITAMVSYMSVYKNESFVVTGHKNGMISVHKVWEGLNGEDWSSLFMEIVSTFGSAEDGSAITILEVHHVGRTRYILSTDMSGWIRVFKENGAVHGSLKPGTRPLAFLKQRLLFLTETGAGSLDLRNMKLRETECEGLNHSLARNYVFDATERSKAYGFTSEGELIHVLLLGDIVNFKCRVRFKRKVDMEEPLAIQAIKGYLLVVNPDKVFVYNVSSQHYVRVGMPRLIFSAGLDEIRSSFVIYQATESAADVRKTTPLIATDREKVVVLGLGSGFVGIYRSNLPIYKGEFNTMLWTSPVLFFILFLFVAWHFFAKKKEALTSWGPDDPFSSASATTGAPLVPSSGERSFVDNPSRNGDLLELRGSNSLRQPRRYGSPTRYPSGATSTFRPGSADHSSRPPVDPNFRTASELKYRGPTLESAGFPKRRESLFANSQVVDDSS
ncbi:uncharacterized membrane protein At1g75140 [Punica granatum]|uniref:Uncharacterized protein n=2 Tax=Punica granatum TaxID=22663 RepID=A0A218X7P8_PUNGR|nr:uncharacterized membrane protein At1g75140 [Punica granatum]OWM80828.1 hypothetical protein CDL15_Pgr006859 [Punica granatum]PKI43740.1 hypothetical protein CRG98_035846 [Punica granatum]